MTDTTINILKKSTSPKLSYRAEGDLTYHIGHNSSSKSYYFRITANSNGGFFSNEWIALNDIAETATRRARFGHGSVFDRRTNQKV